MGSSRLPGKVLKPILGKPVLVHLLERLKRCRELDEIIVTTSTLSENDPIEEVVSDIGVPIFRGSEDDVLGRMIAGLLEHEAIVGVNVFGDCPLIDPHLVDQLITEFKSRPDLDFLGNDLRTTYPPGMEVEVFKFSALRTSGDRAVDPEIREHGTLYMRLHSDEFAIENAEAPPEFARTDLSLGLDTAEDFRVISEVFGNFRDSPVFGLREIIQFMDTNPELKLINSEIPRRWRKYRNDP